MPIFTATTGKTRLGMVELLVRHNRLPKKLIISHS